MRIPRIGGDRRPSGLPGRDLRGGDARPGGRTRPRLCHPLGTSLTIAGGVLQLAPRGEGRGRHLPIDRFFKSLADDPRDAARRIPRLERPEPGDGPIVPDPFA